MRTCPHRCVLFVAALVSTAPLLADDPPTGVGALRALKLDLREGIQDEVRRQAQAQHQPEEAHAIPDLETAAALKSFGRPGTDWLGVGGGYANDLDTDEDYELFVTWSRFLAHDLEFILEGGLWYFDQAGDNTGGLSGSFLFRWHFWHDPEYDWTLYGDAGIGLLAAFDQVPDGGTGLGFLPRIGVGVSHRLGDSHTRLNVGVRWHHISNGRIAGDERNPGRDAPMIYAVVQWPF
ncbi:MAG TPA: acyloxyacyl hydrolase [Phycisphaerales bacterium]|nr:acyloxyacyl hydrolase [Phycisphaerales bacterium]